MKAGEGSLCRFVVIGYSATRRYSHFAPFYGSPTPAHGTPVDSILREHQLIIVTEVTKAAFNCVSNIDVVYRK